MILNNLTKCHVKKLINLIIYREISGKSRSVFHKKSLNFFDANFKVDILSQLSDEQSLLNLNGSNFFFLIEKKLNKFFK